MSSSSATTARSSELTCSSAYSNPCSSIGKVSSIDRLIAEFHGGGAVAANRPDGGGAMFTVNLPLI
jgi:hypothetical protein